MSYNLGLGDTDNINIDNQEVEVLQLNSNIIWSKDNSPEWFYYTGIDENGNIEGSSAYNGTAVAYGMGKPKITTSSDGTETIKWEQANAINNEYYKGIYGDTFIDKWTDDSTTKGTQCVPDTLEIPDTHKGKPITTIFLNAFYCKMYNTQGSPTYYQPFFYKSVVFGKNITTIDSAFCGMSKTKISVLRLPNTAKLVSESILGSTQQANDYNRLTALEVNSNITELSGESNLYGYIQRVIFNIGVSEIKNPISMTLTPSGLTWVFKHAADAPMSITFSSKPKTAQKVTIYSDNNIVNNYDWSTNGNVTATIKPLSEYVEE